MFHAGSTRLGFCQNHSVATVSERAASYAKALALKLHFHGGDCACLQSSRALHVFGGCAGRDGSSKGGGSVTAWTATEGLCLHCGGREQPFAGGPQTPRRPAEACQAAGYGPDRAASHSRSGLGRLVLTQEQLIRKAGLPAGCLPWGRVPQLQAMAIGLPRHGLCHGLFPRRPRRRSLLSPLRRTAERVCTRAL